MRKAILGAVSMALGFLVAGQAFSTELSGGISEAKVVRSVQFDGQEARVIRVQNGNIAPVCANWEIVINAPAYATASSYVAPQAFVMHCSDPNGDTLTLVNPAGGYTFTLQPYVYSVTVPFSVSDGHGGTGNAVLTVRRQ